MSDIFRKKVLGVIENEDFYTAENMFQISADITMCLEASGMSVEDTINYIKSKYKKGR